MFDDDDFTDPPADWADDDTALDLSEDIEPVVYLLTVYPDPDELSGALDDGWVENALLVLPEVKSVSLKRVSSG